jgi:hypothetical protein
LALQTCASPGVKNGGELSKYPSTGLYLAGGKWHGTITSYMGHEMGNAVDRRNIER